MKMRITVTVPIELNDNELLDMGFSSTDPEIVAQEQKEWLIDGSDPIAEHILNSNELNWTLEYKDSVIGWRKV